MELSRLWVNIAASGAAASAAANGLLNESAAFPSNYAHGSDSAQPDVSELDLVKRCQAGESEAFDELVTRYRTRVFGMIYNMVHSEQDAWDLAQDSFVKAWKSIQRFRGQSSFTPGFIASS
jgi:RNA polymerase sigma-70 factor (ECF subfamily)